MKPVAPKDMPAIPNANTFIVQSMPWQLGLRKTQTSCAGMA